VTLESPADPDKSAYVNRSGSSIGDNRPKHSSSFGLTVAVGKCAFHRVSEVACQSETGSFIRKRSLNYHQLLPRDPHSFGQRDVFPRLPSFACQNFGFSASSIFAIVRVSLAHAYTEIRFSIPSLSTAKTSYIQLCNYLQEVRETRGLADSGSTKVWPQSVIK